MATCGKCKRTGVTIDHVRSCYGVTMTSEAAQAAAEILTATPDPVEITEGFWKLGSTIYRVVPSQSSGYLYATKLEPTDGGEKWSWTYAPGAMRKMREEGAHRLTLEEAQAFGQLYGVCARCGRTLTNPESIEAGIGPICAEKGW